MAKWFCGRGMKFFESGGLCLDCINQKRKPKKKTPNYSKRELSEVYYSSGIAGFKGRKV